MSKLTRQHFQAIADVIAREMALASHEEARNALRRTAGALADTLDRFNPQFDHHRFMAACSCPIA